MAQVGYGVVFLMTAPLIGYFRRVVQPTEHLAFLGMGRVKISARAARNLRKWNKLLRMPKLFFRGRWTLWRTAAEA